MTQTHTEQQLKQIVAALDLIDSRTVYIKETHDKAIIDKWTKFVAVLDMFCYELNNDRRPFETIEQVTAYFTPEQFETIVTGLKILDNDINTGNVDEDSSTTYQSLFNDHYFEHTFVNIMWSIASE